ncbi:MAG: glucose-1-phosphate thymidylyltransferase [Coprothermobacterota bacterium]|nr:glucose-1-phosphate thymidylyltransferase [Coprothermobacterota bacterium]
MKALILCGGKGTRLRPLTYAMPKHLIPIANKPILDYAVEKIHRCGIQEIGFVVSPETGQEIRDHYGPAYSYYTQEQPLGIAHAVQVAASFLEDDSLLLFLGDNLLEDDFQGALDQFRKEELDALICLKEVEDPRRFGVAVLDPQGNIERLIEKPKDPPSKLAILGLYLFSPAVLLAVKAISSSWRNEYEITDAIQWLVDHGRRVKGRETRGWWMDTGKKEDLLEANRYLLDTYARLENRGEVDEGSRLVGRVMIEEGAIIQHSTLRGPCMVGAGARILRSTIDPFTSVGPRCLVEDSTVAFSVLMEESCIRSIPRLEESIIGRRAVIEEEDGNGPRIRLHAGDETELRIAH